MNSPALDVLLLVEDNDDDALLIEETLHDAAFARTLLKVTDGEQALAFLRREGKYREVPVPDMILLDVRIPKKDGFKVLQEIKKNGELQHIPVIILTAIDNPSDVVRSYRKGACSYIVKPPDYGQFCDVLRHMIYYWKSVARVPAQPVKTSGSRLSKPAAAEDD